MAVKNAVAKNWVLTLYAGRYYSDNTSPSGAGEALLEWDTVAGATGYRIYYGTTEGGPYDQAFGSGIDAGNVLFYLVTGLTPSTRVYFKVTSYGSDPDSEVGLPFVDEVYKDIT